MKKIYMVIKLVTTNACTRGTNVIIMSKDDGITDDKLLARLGVVSIRFMETLKVSD